MLNEFGVHSSEVDIKQIGLLSFLFPNCSLQPCCKLVGSFNSQLRWERETKSKRGAKREICMLRLSFGVFLKGPKIASTNGFK